jgi:PIN domain nuclease of toxin-antitoxin system
MHLLDTCSLLWLAADHARLSEAAVTRLLRYPDEVFVSAISAFEIGTKVEKGKRFLALQPIAALRAYRIPFPTPVKVLDARDVSRHSASACFTALLRDCFEA